MDLPPASAVDALPEPAPCERPAAGEDGTLTIAPAPRKRRRAAATAGTRPEQAPQRWQVQVTAPAQDGVLTWTAPVQGAA